MKSVALAAVLVLAGVVPASAQDLLAQPFSDHGVLQRDRPIAVWGQAGAGEAVSVELGGRTARATAGRDGRWRAELPAMSAGGFGASTLACPTPLYG